MDDTAYARHFRGPLILFVFVAIGVVGIFRFDLTIAVDYRLGRVVSVQQIPGSDAISRLVVVDLDEYQRVIRTSDPYIPTEIGGALCVKRRKLLLRRWTWHSAEVMLFCGQTSGGFGSQSLGTGFAAQ